MKYIHYLFILFLFASFQVSANRIFNASTGHKFKLSLEKTESINGMETAIHDAFMENSVFSKNGGTVALGGDKISKADVIIKGVVTDSSNGAPLEGVTIRIKDGTEGTVTDANGEFSISTSNNEQAVLLVTTLGYETKEVSIRGRDILNISLARASTKLDQLVVIGYGTEKRKDLTGAISDITGDRVAERNTTMVSEALQGQIPGVMVTRNNGEPGSSSSIRIRGVTTIGNSSPLILVNGVPIDDIDEVNPNDIDNLTVLKDASAAAIYGSRAAAGVILITTKEAKSGSFSVNFNYNKSIVKPTRLPKFGNAKEFMKMVNELKWNDNPGGGKYSTYPESMVNNYDELNAKDPDQYPNTNWTDLIMKDYAQRDNYYLSIDGGSDKIQSRVSIGYDKDAGLLIVPKKFERVTFRVRNNVKVNKWFNSFLNFSFNHSENENPVVSPFDQMFRSSPIFVARWSNGAIGPGKNGSNIYGQILNGGSLKRNRDIINGQLGFGLTPLKGLDIKALVSPEFTFVRNKNFHKKNNFYSVDDPNLEVGTISGGLSTRLQELRTSRHQITSQLIADYNRTFGDHKVDLMGGFESFYLKNEKVGAFSDRMTLTNYPYLDLNNPNYLENSGNAYEYSYKSYFGRLNYNYKGKYLLQGSIRFDGSSRFSKENRWGAFPSVSVGWVLSEEGFLKEAKAISFLKVTGSYGSLGNERISNYPYQSKIEFSNVVLKEGDNVTSLQTAGQYAYTIRDISWETTNTFNVGLDLMMFRNRLSFNGSIYRKETSEMLLELAIPMFMGLSNPEQNTGMMRTNGWEITLGWDDSFGEVKYGISANLSNFRSKLGYLGGIQFLGDKVKLEGSSFDEWYGYLSEGIYQTQKEIDESAHLFSGVQPGDIHYKDISGPDGKPDGVINQYDKTLLGPSLPHYTYGGNIYLNYRDWDFSLDFQGVGKRNSRMTQYMVEPYLSKWGNIPRPIMGKYWSKYNSTGQNEKASYPRLSSEYEGNNYAMSDFWLFNGSYFRLKSITLGYTLPEALANLAFMKKLRIYATVDDLFSLSKFPQGWDPEAGNSSYPITSTYSLGISIKF